MANSNDFCDGETEEQHQMRLRVLRRYRKAVRRDLFRSRAIAKRFGDLLRPGVFTAGRACAPDGERSVAGPVPGNAGNPLPPPTRRRLSHFGLSHETMGESHDETTGRNDSPPSSSNSDTPDGYDCHQVDIPGQEQEPANTLRREEQPLTPTWKGPYKLVPPVETD